LAHGVVADVPPPLAGFSPHFNMIENATQMEP
jgi:hypothetical protein